MNNITLLNQAIENDGANLYAEIIKLIRHAKKSIEMHVFVWRNDSIGNIIARELLKAAQRGVKIAIKKDVSASFYEHHEKNGKSFLNKEIPNLVKFKHKLCSLALPNSYCKDDYDNELYLEFAKHINISISWVEKTHQKYYIFDDEILILGSLNIEERHLKYHDYMVKIEEKNVSEPLNHAHFTAGDGHENARVYYFNNVDKKKYDIMPEIMGLINSAQKKIDVEMAYIGEGSSTKALIEASKRGVQLRIILSKNANIGNDLNYYTAELLSKQKNISIFISDKMIHSKMMMFDDEVCFIGSSNLSVVSLQKYEELMLKTSSTDFALELKKVFDYRVRICHKMNLDNPINYRRGQVFLQKIYQKIFS